MKTLKIAIACFLSILLFAGNANAATIRVGVIATINSTSSISLSSGSFDFGTLAGTVNSYRFRYPQDSVAYLSYFAAGPYEIRVYTDNDVGAGAVDKRGFIASGTGDRLPLKIWCPNFNANKHIDSEDGPSLAAMSARTHYIWRGYDLNDNGTPDEELTSGTYSEATLGVDVNGDRDLSDTFTASPESPIGEGASLAWIREYDTHIEGDTEAAAATRCTLAWNTTGRGDASLANPFPIFFAADVTSVPNGTYASANNVVQGIAFELLTY